MRAVVQRVSQASVSVDGQIVGEIAQGLLVLVAVHRDDEAEFAPKMADRIAGLRIFADAEGKTNLSLYDLLDASLPAGLLLISNFTLYGDASKNRRPSFSSSAPFERGKELFDLVVQAARERLPLVQTGVFGADMEVRAVNQGPVTLILEVGS